MLVLGAEAQARRLAEARELDTWYLSSQHTIQQGNWSRHVQSNDRHTHTHAHTLFSEVSGWLNSLEFKCTSALSSSYDKVAQTRRAFLFNVNYLTVSTKDSWCQEKLPEILRSEKPWVDNIWSKSKLWHTKQIWKVIRVKYFKCICKTAMWLS